MIQHVAPLQRQRARAMRSSQTDAETRLWDNLRAKRLGGLKFRRQTPMGSYIVDFFCANCALVVEVDGGQHETRVGYDRRRTNWLKSRGYRVLRFTNAQVLNETPRVLAAIRQACA